MAQYLKPEVARRISEAALLLFAQRGFDAASMADIAKEARVSTGNVYRYFANKDVLFDTVVPQALPRRLVSLLEQRVRALRGVRDVAVLPADASFHTASEELVAFAVRHRLETIILLGRPDNTPYASFPARVQAMLEKLALAHFEALDPNLRATPAQRMVLRLVYRNLLRSMVSILERCENEEAIREAVSAYGRYHLAGLDRLFAHPQG
jgi:AcrR family transcriptional regulator